MVAYCCAYNCKEKGIKGSPYSFHSFPRDEIRRREWEIAVRRKDFKATNSTKICSKHFEPDCFDREKLGGAWLKSDAVPTIFDFPDHLLKKTRKQRKLPICLQDTKEPTTNILTSSGEVNREKRKYFIGDFKEEDMESPTKAKQFFEMANKQILLKSATIKQLHRKNVCLTKRNASIQTLLWQTQNRLSDMVSAKRILEKNKVHKKLPAKTTKKVTAPMKQIPSNSEVKIPLENQNKDTLENKINIIDDKVKKMRENNAAKKIQRSWRNHQKKLLERICKIVLNDVFSENI